MPIPIRILMKGTRFDAELFDTACAGEIGRVLPLDAVPNEWGDEFSFEIPVSMPPDETATSCDKRGEPRRVRTSAPSRQVL